MFAISHCHDVKKYESSIVRNDIWRWKSIWNFKRNVSICSLFFLKQARVRYDNRISIQKPKCQQQNEPDTWIDYMILNAFTAQTMEIENLLMFFVVDVRANLLFQYE